MMRNRPRPSCPSGNQDRESASSGCSYLILSVQKGMPAEMRYWRVLADRSDFELEQTQMQGL
jgi:hypothetical protein